MTGWTVLKCIRNHKQIIEVLQSLTRNRSRALLFTTHPRPSGHTPMIDRQFMAYNNDDRARRLHTTTGIA